MVKHTKPACRLKHKSSFTFLIINSSFPLPFNYYDIENEIATKLTVLLSAVALATVLFENEKDRKTAQDAAQKDNKALVIVAYNGSDFQNSNSLNYLNQDDSMTFVCNVMANNLRSTNGIHNVIRLIKSALLGFQPANSSRLVLKSIEFESRDNDTAMWSYNVSFTCNKKAVQATVDGDDDTTASANLVQTIFDDKSINNISY